MNTQKFCLEINPDLQHMFFVSLAGGLNGSSRYVLWKKKSKHPYLKKKNKLYKFKWKNVW